MTDLETPSSTPARPPSSVESTLLTLAVLGAVVLLLSFVTLLPRGSGPTSVVGATGDDGILPLDDALAAGLADTEGAGAAGGGGAASGKAATAGGSASGAGGVPVTGIDCNAGKNGGSTDAGVTAGVIKLGASTVDSGAGASFLHPVVSAMSAVVAKTNSAGGICGRKLKLSLHDSGWRAEAGFEIIRNLVQGEKVFALAVNPDSEGLDFASAQGYLAQQKVPVIGTDGLLVSQYQDPWIWPVAAPTVSAMYAIATSQCEAGLRDFSIVFETTYRFGREGAKAYNLAAKKCTGQDIRGYYDPDKGQSQCSQNFCGILSGATSYSGEVSKFCTGKCDAGAVLLEPATAQVWFANGGPEGRRYEVRAHPGALATPQPLFSAAFAKQCNTVCHGLRVWTGFLPPMEQFAGRPAVQQYVNDVKGFDPSIDVTNQFVEGGYLGMLLVAKGLDAASRMPGGLTRANVAKVLDSTSGFDTGLTVRPLSWRPGNHFAQTTVHAFDEQYGDTGFGGWRYTGVEVTDPDPFAATK